MAGCAWSYTALPPTILHSFASYGSSDLQVLCVLICIQVLVCNVGILGVCLGTCVLMCVRC